MFLSCFMSKWQNLILIIVLDLATMYTHYFVGGFLVLTAEYRLLPDLYNKKIVSFKKKYDIFSMIRLYLKTGKLAHHFSLSCFYIKVTKFNFDCILALATVCCRGSADPLQGVYERYCLCTLPEHWDCGWNLYRQ